MPHRATAVASHAIELALRGEAFKVQDLRRGIDDPPSRQTIYRVLRQLESDEWVTVDGHTWHPDFKAEALGDVDDSDEDTAGFSIDVGEFYE